MLETLALTPQAMEVGHSSIVARTLAIEPDACISRLRTAKEHVCKIWFAVIAY